MANFTYSAKRTLNTTVSPIHAEGTEYDIDLDLVTATRSRAVVKTIQRSRGGNSEVLRDRADTTWEVTTAPLAGSNLAAVREFLDSVEAGEQFTFDLYGTAAVPDNPIAVERIDEGYTESRVLIVGSEASDYFQFSFTLREL